MKTVETQLAEALEKIKALEADNKKLSEAAIAASKTAAATELNKLMTEAQLPEAAQTRLREHYKEAVSADGMKEAVVRENEYIKSLAAPSRKHNGAADNGTPTQQEQVKEAKTGIVENLKKQGLSEAEAKTVAGL